jgi:hypothetical protein
VGAPPGIPHKFQNTDYYGRRYTPSGDPGIGQPLAAIAGPVLSWMSSGLNVGGKGGPGFDVGTGGAGGGGDSGGSGMVHPLGATGMSVTGASGVTVNHQYYGDQHTNVYQGDYNHQPIHYHDHTSGPGGTQGFQEVQNSYSRAQQHAATPGAGPA